MTFPENPPETAFDLIVLGSGAAGLTAALTAALEGMSVLMLEHQPVFGGTSARSSGTVWVPDNRHMRAAGIADRREAEAYLSALAGASAAPGMLRAFLDAAPAMEADLGARAGLACRPLKTAPDYRQEIEGAAPGWRALEPPAFDGRALGADFERLAAPLPELMLFGGMMVTRPEAAALVRAERSLSAMRLGAGLVSRYLADRLRHRRGTRLVLGNALVARLFAEGRRRGVRLITSASVSELTREQGRVTGVLLDGRRIEGRRGVVLAGGGFPASAEWRAREMPEPIAPDTPASPGAMGRTLELGVAAGGVLGPSGLDNALWFPSSLMQRRDGSQAVYPHIVLDRAKPGSIAVDASGRRFCNEAVSYHEFVRAMYRRQAECVAIPAWMICDRRFISRYGLGLIRPRTPVLGRYIGNDYLKTGRDASELARKIGVPAEALTETLARFNGFASSGRDADFQRGETLYDRANGDATHGPNLCLGPVGPGRLYAVALYPTPLGTSRGLMADVDARVLDGGGTPIPGLYVAGNDMHSVFGGEYPGAGAQLGQGMTFGWLAARHAAGNNARTTT